MLKSKANEPLKCSNRSQMKLLVIHLEFWFKIFQFLDKSTPVHRFRFLSFNNSTADSWCFASASLICSWEVVFSQKFWWHFHFSSLKDPSPPLPEVLHLHRLRQMDPHSYSTWQCSKSGAHFFPLWFNTAHLHLCPLDESTSLFSLPFVSKSQLTEFASVEIFWVFLRMWGGLFIVDEN